MRYESETVDSVRFSNIQQATEATIESGLDRSPYFLVLSDNKKQMLGINESD